MRQAGHSWLRDRVLAGMLCLFGALGLWLMLVPSGMDARLMAYWGVQPLLDVVMAAGSHRISLLAADATPVARFWQWLTRACLLLTAGDLVQAGATWLHPDLSQLDGGLVHAAFVGTGLMAMVVVTLTHPIGVSGAQRRRTWVDATTVMAGAASFFWYLDAGSTSATTPIMASVALLAVFGLVRLALSDRPPFTRPAALVGVTGVSLLGVIGALTPVVQVAAHPGMVLTLRLLPSVALALTPRVQELGMRADPGVLVRPRRPYSLLPYLAVAACQVLLVLAMDDQRWSVRGWGVVAGNVVVTVLVVLRQLDAFRENASLLSRLDESLGILRWTERRFRSLVQHSSDVTLIVTTDGTINYASPALQVVLGVAPDQAEGRPVVGLFELADDRGVELDWSRIIADRSGPVTGHVQARHVDGSSRWLEVTLTDLSQEPGVQGLVCNARDVTEAHELQARLLHQASHDPLTQVANRAAFEQEVQRVQGAPAHIAVLMIDLDRFKPINDTYGHHVGDQLLVEVAARIRGCVRPHDTVARLGGDEFAVLLYDTTRRQAVAVAERIAATLRDAVPTGDRELQITASVGVAMGATGQLDALLKQADAAMYQAKRDRPRNGYRCAPAGSPTST
jgi:diguanylate cyclase (GGDEF)-like protein/PAS domain S-box-containing protein